MRQSRPRLTSDFAVGQSEVQSCRCLKRRTAEFRLLLVWLGAAAVVRSGNAAARPAFGNSMACGAARRLLWAACLVVMMGPTSAIVPPPSPPPAPAPPVDCPANAARCPQCLDYNYCDT